MWAEVDDVNRTDVQPETFGTYLDGTVDLQLLHSIAWLYITVGMDQMVS